MTDPSPDLSLSDNPVSHPADDRFLFRFYARVLAEQALQAEMPLTIGVFGRWGSGKTSLMHLIRYQLELNRLRYVIERWQAFRRQDGQDASIGVLGPLAGEAPPPASAWEAIKRAWREYDSIKPPRIGYVRTLWIDIWQLSRQEEIWHAFLQALLSTIHRKMPFYRRWWFNLSLLVERINWAALPAVLLANSYRALVVILPVVLQTIASNYQQDIAASLLPFVDDPALGWLVTGILGLWLLGRPAVDATREKVTLDFDRVFKTAPYEAQITSLQSLEGHFARMVRALVGRHGRLVIFVDDLDRCALEKIPDVLEAIKLFTTNANCIYVLGLDNLLVQEALEKKFQGANPDSAEEYVQNYMEKIVQIPFSVPLIERNLVADFVKTYKIDPDAEPIFLEWLKYNPRKIKRMLNVYLVERAIRNAQGVTFEPELLAKSVIIQTDFPRIYRQIEEQPELLRDLEPDAI